MAPRPASDDISRAPVDRTARAWLADAAESWLAGRITNDELYVADVPRSADPAVAAVRGALWLTWDDMREHRCNCDPDTRADIARWILFLRSDRPYAWPRDRVPGADPAGRISRFARLRRALFLEDWPLTADEAAAILGGRDYAAWPFTSAAEARRAAEGAAETASQQPDSGA
ncbi:hypothetical protein ACQ5SO_06435 [Rhodovulum sp. DZ06]|uniref:hypothetical protein n=1 Tax=Rhodovulum sp. DZ06 TaxID=3425126 RepID=UPI003D33C9CC